MLKMATSKTRVLCRGKPHVSTCIYIPRHTNLGYILVFFTESDSYFRKLMRPGMYVPGDTYNSKLYIICNRSIRPDVHVMTV